MKLAISNLAWPKHDDLAILRMLREKGVKGIEIAPTMVWPQWQGVDQRRAEQYRAWLSGEGFEVPAMQAIVFGRPELRLFQPETHSAFVEHMKLVADLAAGLGAKVLVFGAPSCRKRGQLSMSQAIVQATEFFRKIGTLCATRGCCIGWEHNPIEYGCDFITNATDAREFVDGIDHPGVQLHIDSAGVHLCGGDIGEVIKGIGHFVHYHISEPQLAPIAAGVVDHATALRALSRCEYPHWVSIEMKCITENTEPLLRRCVDTVLAAASDSGLEYHP